jgi:hypothetical protein
VDVVNPAYPAHRIERNPREMGCIGNTTRRNPRYYETESRKIQEERIGKKKGGRTAKRKYLAYSS